MSTLAEKIAVMQAFERGEKIEYMMFGEGEWSKASTPIWDWRSSEYRVAKPAPKKVKLLAYVYPDGTFGWFFENSRAHVWMHTRNFTRVPSEDKEVEVAE